MKYTYILWDFNGTILDDVQTGIDCVNTLLKRRGLAEIPDKDYYRSVFGFPVIDYYRRLGFDFAKEDYHDIAVEWVELYNQKSKFAPVNPGIKEMLELFRLAGTKQYILSATELCMLKAQVEQLGIGVYFDGIFGLDNIHAGSKTSLAEIWASRVEPGRTLLVGDSVHDYECALKIGADCVLYSGGHMNREALEKCGCGVIDDIRLLREYI